MPESQNGQCAQLGQVSPGFAADEFVPAESISVGQCADRADPSLIPGSSPMCQAEALCIDARRIEAALERLSPRDRLMIRIRHLDQLSFERIANGLGLSTTAVQARWARAVQNLCRELQVDGLVTAARSERD